MTAFKEFSAVDLKRNDTSSLECWSEFRVTLFLKLAGSK